jgi:hypothetical protein
MPKNDGCAYEANDVSMARMIIDSLLSAEPADKKIAHEVAQRYHDNRYQNMDQYG